MKQLILVAVGMVLTAFSFSQQVTGLVKDEKGNGLASATAVLKKSKDSSSVKFAISNQEGHYTFSNIEKGSYFVSVSFIGYNEQSSASFELNGSGTVSVPALQLSKGSGNLKEVVVTTRKPAIEVRADKTILNVEGSINSVGQDALELLRKSPGVLVDKDDNLSLSGRNGVQVYIDGRPSPLTGSDLAAYLKSLQSSQIEAIEIISNPSAKYDAAGNAGIINIRLKKNKSYGTNGTVNAGFNQGIYPKFNGGLTLNHRNKRINAYGNYNYNEYQAESFMFLERRLLDTAFNQHSVMSYKNQSHGFKAGLDYFINSRQTIGIMTNGVLNTSDFANYSTTDIAYIPTGDLKKKLVADNSSDRKRNNVNFNLNYRYTDTSGREWTMDADYGFYRISGSQLQPNYYYNPEGTLIDTRISLMDAPSNIDIYSFKTDYEQKFLKGRLGLGGKISNVQSDNDFRRFNLTNTIKNYDTAGSSIFNYKENINAAYANYNRSFKGFIVQFGLRMENTHSEGRSNGYKRIGEEFVVYDSTFSRDYTDLFPSASITFNKKPTNQWSLSYSRRIDRPAYQDLNPFEFKLDEYTYQKGNTELRPQYTNTVSLTNTFKYKLTSTLSYSHVKDVFTQLVDTADKSKAYLTKKNLATQDIVSLNISYPFQYKWYSLFTNVNTYYTVYKADFGQGRTVDLDTYAFNFYAQNSFKLGKGWTGELTGWYNSPSIWEGTFKTDALWSVDVGLMKTVMKGKGNVKASVTDIFQSMRWAGSSNFSGQYVHANGGFESRQFKLNFTYRFGSSQVKSERQRKTGLEDENKRVGTSGGGLGN